MGWKEKIKKWTITDIWPKFICLMIAVFVWSYISGEMGWIRYEQKVLRDINVLVLGEPLKFSNAIFNIKITPQKVDLVVRGPQDKINKISAQNLVVFVDINNIELDKEYPLPVRMILPEGIEVKGPVPLCHVILITKK